MSHALECDHCGGDAIVSDTGYFSDGEGAACATCGWPGHVSIDGTDEDLDENYAYFVLDSDGCCKDPTCDECNMSERDWPTDGTCWKCGAAPRFPKSGLCATCIDERVAVRGSGDPQLSAMARENVSLAAKLRLATMALERADDWIVRQPRVTDHGCTHCLPRGPILRDGFTCVYHEAKARKEACASLSPTRLVTNERK